MKRIPLTKGKFSKVDDRDFAHLRQFSWGVTKDNYARRNHRQQSIYMAVQIMNPRKGFQVDHKNGDTLDNRRKNLRVCTPGQNSRNQPLKKNSSGFKGIYKNWLRGHKKYLWAARITKNHKTYFLGDYRFAKEAAQAYDRAALRLHGEFARTNKMLGLL